MKQLGKTIEYDVQYVDIRINGRPLRAMVDTVAEANIMTKIATRLASSYCPSNAQLMTVNAPSMWSRGWSKHHARRVEK